MEPDYKKAFGELKAFVDNFNLPEALASKLTPDGPASKLMTKA
jgi:hypothetical protein